MSTTTATIAYAEGRLVTIERRLAMLPTWARDLVMLEASHAYGRMFAEGDTYPDAMLCALENVTDMIFADAYVCERRHNGEFISYRPDLSTGTIVAEAR